MKIYLDGVFIENLIIDFILLKETEVFSKQSTKLNKIMKSSILSSLYVVVMLWCKINILNYYICKILLIFVMVYIAFSPKNIFKYLKLVCIFIMISSINIGALELVKNMLNMNVNIFINKISIYIAGFTMSKLFLQTIWKYYKSEIKVNSLNYNVEFRIGNKTYKYKGFLDTGNSVYSNVEKLPVIFANIIDNNIKESLVELESFEIKTVTLSNTSCKKAYIIDDIKISNGSNEWKVRAGIVFEENKFSNSNDYNMILNYILFTESLGGIEL